MKHIHMLFLQAAHQLSHGVSLGLCLHGISISHYYTHDVSLALSGEATIAHASPQEQEGA